MIYDLLLPAGLGVVLILGIGFVLASLYTRSSRDEAYVRTASAARRWCWMVARSCCRFFTPSPASI